MMNGWLVVPLVVGVAGILMALDARAHGPARAVVRLGLLALWVGCSFVAITLVAWLLSPPGIGADNGPQLAVSLVVMIGLPLWVVVRWGTADESGSSALPPGEASGS